MNTSFLQELMGSIAERGRALVDRSATRPVGKGARRAKQPETLESLCRALVSGRGEASGVALARQVLDLYAASPVAARVEFFRLLASGFDPELAGIRRAWEAYQQDAAPANLQALLEAVEPPRQELLRRLNLAPGGTAALVAMREDLLKHGGKEAQLRKVDDDFAHLFGSWFNRGFLVLRPIDWSSPADMLERIIRYEAVHEIQGWDDLRRRVQPSDRRCFGFFHPSLIDEPLIFVEVALTREIPASIQSLLAEERTILAGQGGDDRRLLLDQQLPAGLARRLVRQFPDQAGGRGAVARTARAADLRHFVAGAGLRGLARPGARGPGGCRPRRARPRATAGFEDPGLA